MPRTIFFYFYDLRVFLIMLTHGELPIYSLTIGIVIVYLKTSKLPRI